MKKINAMLLVISMTVSGAFTPTVAAPSMAQVQQFVQEQPETQDPRITYAQEAFAAAAMKYAADKMAEELTENEKQIDAIFEAKDLVQSLQQSVQTVLPPDVFENITTEEELQAKLETLMQEDPQLETKLFNAYRQNKYIKQLIPLLLANQNDYAASELDQQTFDELVIAFVNATVLMQQMMQIQE